MAPQDAEGVADSDDMYRAGRPHGRTDPVNERNRWGAPGFPPVRGSCEPETGATPSPSWAHAAPRPVDEPGDLSFRTKTRVRHSLTAAGGALRLELSVDPTRPFVPTAMKVAAYQAPLLPAGSMEAIGLIRGRVSWCEGEGVRILCCPEAVLGGLADYAARPADIAIDVEGGELAALLSPLASDTVTTIIGFTEIRGGQLYNAAAVYRRGAVSGIYRKLHPAIRRSVYRAGERTPVFTVDGLTFGIVICNDSTFAGPARDMAAQGATALFIPTNNGLPPEKADVVEAARKVDADRAMENRVWVIRADVAGHADGRVSYGSSGIVGPDGRVHRSARRLTEDLLVADIVAAQAR